MPGTPPAAGDILEAQVLTADANQIGENILHYYVSTTVTPIPSLQLICTTLDGTWATPYKNVLNNNATYRGVGLSNITPPRSQQVVSNANAGPGTAGANALPTQVRGLISYYGFNAGPRYRGRSYICFPSQNGSDSSGNPTAAYVTLLGVLRNIFLGPITIVNGAGACTLSLALYHRKDMPPSATLVSTAVARNRFATQRRSGAYGRANVPPF